MTMGLPMADPLDPPERFRLTAGREDRILIRARHNRIIAAMYEQHRTRADLLDMWEGAGFGDAPP